MKELAALLLRFGHGLAAAMLPSPERDRLARRHELDAPRWSLEVGLAEAICGAVLFVAGGLAFMRPAAVDQSLHMLRNWQPGLSTTHFQGAGLLNWLAWFINPASWPFAYLGLTGLTRCVAFAVTREAVAEPVVWAALRSWQAARRRASARERERRLGPPRPDRVLEGPDGALVVLSCRDKPGWTPGVSIEIDNRYYRVEAVREQSDGAFAVMAYRLREQPSGAVIRRLIRYSPPREGALDGSPHSESSAR